MVKVISNLIALCVVNLVVARVHFQENVIITPYKGQDFYNIRAESLKNRTLFEDPEFSPQQALSLSDSEDWSEDWCLRPKEIIKEPKFSVDGISRFDVIQGNQMDCWFASSLASLTLNRNLLQNVVPHDNSFDNAGFFHFRFWLYGKWVDVVIDDRLPVDFMQVTNMRSSNEAEFWSALLEKAYAKMKGSYNALDGGEPEEALVDFTGGIAENFVLREKEAPLELFVKMKEASSENSFMTGDVYPDKSWDMDVIGLHQSHGYSITKAVEIEYIKNGKKFTQPLVRVRNPYGGRFEWTGAWNDKSDLWDLVPLAIKKELEFIPRPDGEFWMPFDDFYKYFTILTIFHVPIPADLEAKTLNSTNWSLKSFEGKWVPGKNSGGSANSTSFYTNPQYRITIDVPEGKKDGTNNTIFVGIMQKYRRENGQRMFPIGVSIYQLSENEILPDVLSAEYFTQNEPIANVEDDEFGMREASAAFSIPAGDYLVVPYMFKVEDKQRSVPTESVDYLLRIFSKK